MTAANANVEGAGADGVIMSAASVVSTATGNVIVQANNESDILLGLITTNRTANAGDVSLTAQRSILDNNGGNVRNVFARHLQMVADSNNDQAGIIGGPDTGNGQPDQNANAIDTEVVRLTARSADGIYVREENDVTVDTIAAFSVEQVNFNSTTTTVTAAQTEDLTTTDNGPIKLQSVGGNIVVNPGALGNPAIAANGTGDVLLLTLAADGDITINGEVVSGTGDISARAGDDLFVNANITTALPGTIHLLAANNKADAASGVTMSDLSVVEATNSNVRIVAQNGGDILLSRVNASSVSLNASNSIIDNNDAVTPNTLNIQANSLQMVASNGRIGNSDTGNAIDNNTAAIDTQVTTLAARAALGIYVREVDASRWTA